MDHAASSRRPTDRYRGRQADVTGPTVIPRAYTTERMRRSSEASCRGAPGRDNAPGLARALPRADGSDLGRPSSGARRPHISTNGPHWIGAECERRIGDRRRHSHDAAASPSPARRQGTALPAGRSLGPAEPAAFVMLRCSPPGKGRASTGATRWPPSRRRPYRLAGIAGIVEHTRYPFGAAPVWSISAFANRSYEGLWRLSWAQEATCPG